MAPHFMCSCASRAFNDNKSLNCLLYKTPALGWLSTRAFNGNKSLNCLLYKTPALGWLSTQRYNAEHSTPKRKEQRK
eukprot:2708805-Amphidinium_carterae.1